MSKGKLERDILHITHLFGPQHEPTGVPYDELLSQLHVLGYWPNIKRDGRIRIKVYAKADRQVQEAISRLAAAGLIEQPSPTAISLTEAGDVANRV